MNIELNWSDLIPISHLIILFITSLIIILIESFGNAKMKATVFFIAIAGLLIALGSVWFFHESRNPFLASWLRFDSLSHFFTLFFLFIGIASILLAYPFLSQLNLSQSEYYFLLLSSIIGLILIAEAADFLILFLGIEILSISLYILCGYIKKWNISHEAALKYFFMGSISSAFFLYGIALIYGTMGTTNFHDLLPAYQNVDTPSENALFFGGIALVTVGLAFEAAVVPFHFWAPDVYEGSPTALTAFMAVGTKVGAFAAFMILFLLFLPLFDIVWSQGVACLAYATLIYGNILALRQTQLRRFFAYSGISHAGFLLIPLVAGGQDALSAMTFYLVIYGLATFGCFSVLVLIEKYNASIEIKDLKSLFFRSPLLATILTISLLTLAGLPPTAGFFAKFYIFKVAFEQGYYGLVMVGLFTTILAAYYYIRMISVMLQRDENEVGELSFNWPALTVGLVSLGLLVLLSIHPII